MQAVGIRDLQKGTRQKTRRPRMLAIPLGDREMTAARLGGEKERLLENFTALALRRV